MELTFLHLLIIIATIAVAIGGGLYAARSVKTAEGYSLGGRSSGNGGRSGPAQGGHGKEFFQHGRKCRAP